MSNQGVAVMKDKRVHTRSVIIIALAWLVALALLYLVIIKFKILFR
jgi:hypothetical protein